MKTEEHFCGYKGCHEISRQGVLYGMTTYWACPAHYRGLLVHLGLENE